MREENILNKDLLEHDQIRMLVQCHELLEDKIWCCPSFILHTQHWDHYINTTAEGKERMKGVILRRMWSTVSMNFHNRSGLEGWTLTPNSSCVQTMSWSVVRGREEEEVGMNSVQDSDNSPLTWWQASLRCQKKQINKTQNEDKNRNLLIHELNIQGNMA